MGRNGEIERLRQALARVRNGDGDLLVLHGPAGAGKTHLLRDAMELARGQRFEVLSATGGPLAKEASFAVVLELLQPLLEELPAEEIEADIAPLVASDPAVTLEVKPPATAAYSNAGLARVCVDAAAEQPLLLVVDDVQWADAPSLGALEAIARRIKRVPVLLLLGMRPGEETTNPEAISLLMGELLGERLEIGPLSDAGVGELLTLRGVETEGAAAVGHAARLTGGNALLVTRVAATLIERDESASVASLNRVAGENAIDVAASVTSQLRRLGEAASEVAVAAAVLDEHAHWRHVLALVSVTEPEASRACDRLVAAGLVEHGEPLRFSHPLVREAVYRAHPPGGIDRLHRAAAAGLAAEAVDAEQVASHILLTRGQGSAESVRLLEAAARQAMRRGVPTTAAQYLERALAEPAGGEDRPRVLILLGRVRSQLGYEGAAHLLQEARDLAGDALLRGEADLGLGQELYARGSYAEAEMVLERGRRELKEWAEGRGNGAGEKDGLGALAAELSAASLAASRYAGTLRASHDERLAGLLEGDMPGATRAERSLLAELAAELGVQGEPRETVISLALRAWADGEMLITADQQGIAISQTAAALVWSDAYDEAEEMLTMAARHSAAVGARTGQATARYMRGWVRLYRGQLGAALADGRAALRGDRWSMYTPSAAALVAHTLIEQGEWNEAASALELPGGDGRWDASIPFALTLEARARLKMVQGRYAEALELLDECERLCSPMGCHQPFSQWRTRRALCLFELEDADGAAVVIAEEIEPCRRAGAPRPLGMALAAAGLIQGDEKGVALAAEGCAVLAGSGAVIEEARALVAHGSLLRRLDRAEDARRPLRQALALADGAGAVVLAEHAAGELTAAGGRPRRRALDGPSSLTPAERRAARLAAAGHTNREIADRLVVTPKTVQFHLSNAYRKLGVASRAELDGAL